MGNIKLEVGVKVICNSKTMTTVHDDTKRKIRLL